MFGLDLCKNCDCLYENYKHNLLRGSGAYRPLFCADCEKKYAHLIYSELIKKHSKVGDEK